jgi:sugar-specific transcriptional regulator TrmB
MLFEKNVETLERAGLSHSQARVYLTLTIVGRTSIKTIAQVAKTDPANTSRAILGLQKLSLVDKTISKPNLYEAIPIKEGIELLLKRKKDEFTEVDRLSKLIIEQFDNVLPDQPQMDKDQFLIVPPKTSYVHSSLNNFQNAKDSIDLISTQKRSAQSKEVYSDAERKALNRGVKIRTIMEKPTEKINIIQQQTSKVLNGVGVANIKRRFIQEVPKVVGGIFDNKIATFLINPNADYMNSPCLLTNHEGFILMFRNYFDALWESGTPE